MMLCRLLHRAYYASTVFIVRADGTQLDVRLPKSLPVFSFSFSTLLLNMSLRYPPYRYRNTHTSTCTEFLCKNVYMLIFSASFGQAGRAIAASRGQNQENGSGEKRVFRTTEFAAGDEDLRAVKSDSGCNRGAGETRRRGSSAGCTISGLCRWRALIRVVHSWRRELGRVSEEIFFS